ncbi:hypothetical protein ACQJBY_020555 [Aegilops geniculata]
MGKREEREKDEGGVSQRMKVGAAGPIFTMDDFDCSICCHPLRPPIFQCQHTVGHTICSSCHDKLPGKCCFCSLPTVYNRCQWLEDVVETLKVSCPNGCTATIKYYQKEEHEKDCPHAPCFCPLADCGFSGPTAMLVEHFSGKHNLRSLEVPYSEWFGIYMQVNADPPISATAVVGQDGHLFLVCIKRESSGGIIKVCCVQPHITGIKFKCGLALSCTQTGYSQVTEFQTRNTNLYDGFPDDGFPFLVPKMLLPAAGTSDTIVVHMELTPQ